MELGRLLQQFGPCWDMIALSFPLHKGITAKHCEEMWRRIQSYHGLSVERPAPIPCAMPPSNPLSMSGFQPTMYVINQPNSRSVFCLRPTIRKHRPSKRKSIPQTPFEGLKEMAVTKGIVSVSCGKGVISAKRRRIQQRTYTHSSLIDLSTNTSPPFVMSMPPLEPEPPMLVQKYTGVKRYFPKFNQTYNSHRG